MRKYLIFCLFVATCLFGKNEYFEKAKEGWFYYQDPIKELDDNRSREDEAFVASLPEDFSKMSTEEFKKSEERVRDIATMKPSEENINAWKRMIKFANDQSKKFTINWKMASLIDDRYDYSEIGTGGFSQKNMEFSKKERDKAKFLTDNVVFVTFVKDGSSTLTQKQITANLDLRREFGVNSRTFSTEDFPEMVKKLDITNEIENFVYYKDDQKWQRIRRGLIDAETYVNDFMFFEENKDVFKNDKKEKE